MDKCGMERDKLYKMRDFVENSAQVKALYHSFRINLILKNFL